MRYEDMVTEGAVGELRRLMGALGIDEASVRLLDVAKQLGEVTHRAEPNEKQQQQTGLMPGHLTHLTTDPGAHDVFSDVVARGAFSKRCNLTAEIELIELGFGEWLTLQRYPLRPTPPHAADALFAKVGREAALAAAPEPSAYQKMVSESGAKHAALWDRTRRARRRRRRRCCRRRHHSRSSGRPTSSSTRCRRRRG